MLSPRRSRLRLPVLLSPRQRTRLLLSALLGVLVFASGLGFAVPVTAAPAPAIATSDSSADDAYVSTYAELFSRAFAAGEVFTEPASRAFWDDRQRGIVAEQVDAVEAAGFEANIALLGELPSYDRAGQISDLQEDTALLQRIVLADAEQRSVESAIYIVWDGRATYSLVMEDGVLRKEMDYDLGYSSEINFDVPGPAVSYALRTSLDPNAELDPTEVEAAPRMLFESLPRPAEVMRSDGGGFVLSAVIITAAGAALALAYLILFSSTGCVQRTRRQRALRRRQCEAEHRRGLTPIRDRAIAAHRELERRRPLPGDIAEATVRLPAPEDTTNPVVWVAWRALRDELRGSTGRRCFFRPDLQAKATFAWEGFGGEIELPVSEAVHAALVAGKDPDYLSAEGIGRGKPYWQVTKSPFAASGFGAFGPLSSAIAAMPEDWQPEPGAHRSWEEYQAEETVSSESPADRKRREGRARPLWLDVVVVGLLIPALAIGGTWYWTWHNHVEQAKIASPAFLPAEAIVDQLDTRRIDAIAEAVAEDGVYIDPKMRRQFSTEDEARLVEELAELEPRTVVVAIILERTDEFRGDRGLYLQALYERIPADTVTLTVGASRVEPESPALRGDFEAVSAMRERVRDLPPYDQVGEYVENFESLSWERKANATVDYDDYVRQDAESYEPLPSPGSPEYFDNLRGDLARAGVIGYIAVIVLFFVFLRNPFNKRRNPFNKRKDS